MFVPRRVTPRVVVFSEVVWVTALVVTSEDSFTSVILFDVVGGIIVANFSETVIVVDPDEVTSLPGMFGATGAMIVAGFGESADTDEPNPLTLELDANGAAVGAL